MADEPIDELTLADWRRRVADLYAEVRRRHRADPGDALRMWRREREALFREHPQSPVPPAGRAAFRSLHFDPDPALRFEVTVQREDDALPSPAVEPPPDVLSLEIAAGGIPSFPVAQEPVAEAAPALGFAVPAILPVSGGGGAMSLRRIGFVDVPFPAGQRRLGLFWMEGYAGGLFLPFRDATNGHETYAAGRYLLDSAKSADLGGDGARGTLMLDFNFAYQPSCAFDPRWACPLAPPENWLDIAVRAGERIA